MRPRIGLDMRMVDRFETGLGRYARELARHLPALRPEWEFILIKRPLLSGEVLGRAPNVSEVTVSGCLDHPRNLLAGPAVNRLGLDVYHSLHQFLPPGLRVPRVALTLHDLIWVEHARLTFDTRWAWMLWRVTHLYGLATMRHALGRADHVVAISAHSAERARARCGLPPDRVSVVHHGADHATGNGDGTLRRESDEPYLLSLGNSKPYKNLRGLLHAFALTAPRRPGLRLKIVGRGDSFGNLRTLADRLGIAARVHFVGRVDDAELRRLFAGARALVFPSLIEGFGLPLVEAMALGCPVVTSAIPVVREIVGDAAVCVNPARPAAIAAAIERVLGDLKLRRRLTALGRDRAQRFTWKACAEGTAAVYRDLLG
ncbi:MAG: glycosyltransferase family 4 protein [Desulfobacterales bacterium]|nr:glycosyltransferase family 4 protein [Desulfobacterales bacterium]